MHKQKRLYVEAVCLVIARLGRLSVGVGAMYSSPRYHDSCCSRPNMLRSPKIWRLMSTSIHETLGHCKVVMGGRSITSLKHL